jgi:hypothetical protein
MGSVGERGTNFEFRVQNAKAPALPAPPRMAVLRTVRMKPIVKALTRVRCKNGELLGGREKGIRDRRAQELLPLSARDFTAFSAFDGKGPSPACVDLRVKPQVDISLGDLS